MLLLGLVTLVVWSGAQVAGMVASGQWLAASPAQGLAAAVRLPARAGAPASAWPAEVQATLPGPVLYWASTVVAAVAEVGAAVWVWVRFARPLIGTRRRDRLGVAVGARLASMRDMAPLIVITTPIFLPVAMANGVDPVHFGIILMINLGIGLVTPPVGSVLFVGSAVGKLPIAKIVRTIWPFYLTLIAALLLISFVPALSLWLPGQF